MTTSQFTAGVVRRSATFCCGLKGISPCEGNRLEQNYRSAQQILSAASHVIAIVRAVDETAVDRSRGGGQVGSRCGMARSKARLRR